jgi:hypothetical protein
MDDLGDRIIQAGLAKLASLKDEGERIERDMVLLVKEIQSSCSHPENEIVEGEHYVDRPSIDIMLALDRWSDFADPPFRVCRRCGYSEPGWGSGYFSLAPDNYHVSRMTRDEAWKFIRGGLMSREEKERLFRARWDREGAARAEEAIETITAAVCGEFNNG